MTKEEKKNLDAVIQMEKTLVDNIFNACKENSENFEVDYTPITFIKVVCDLAQQGIESSLENSLQGITDKKVIKQVRNSLKLNKTMLTAIYNSCKKSADSFHVDYVPIKFLRMTCDSAFKVVETGLKQGFGN